MRCAKTLDFVLPGIRHVDSVSAMFKLATMSSSICSQVRTVTFLTLVVCLELLEARSQNSNVLFPTFTSTSEFIMMGDVQYSGIDSSFVFNTAGTAESGSSCGELFLKRKVRFEEYATGRFASFSTAFTFLISAPVSGSGGNGSTAGGTYSFWIGDANITLFQSYTSNISSCAMLTPSKYRFLAVVFDTVHRDSYEDLSNNHLDIYVNDQVVQAYNLCGTSKTSNCSYLVNGGFFTAWVDYNGTTQMLEVRLTNGTFRSAQKPLQPLIQVPNLDLTNITKFNDFLYVGFSGMSGYYGQNPVVNEVLSWSFVSSGLPPIPKPNLTTILAISVPIVVFMIVVLFLGYNYWRQRSIRNHSIPTLTHLIGARMFTYKELCKATKNFSKSELLGSGGFGDVYKGTLQPFGILVAVKRMKHENKQGEGGFLAEASSISQIHHRNLVQMKGWCQENGEMLLVYDYMCNGNLNEWLFGCRLNRKGLKSYKREVLTLKVRHSILAGIAAALEYLHEDWMQCILHRDIKSSNVMLDADFNAHLGDFGLARLIEHKKMDKTTLLAGTLGYMAPEMPYTGKATKAADVYSFGVLILEVVCGRRPLDLQTVEPEDLVLLNSVWRAHEAGDLFRLVDPRLLANSDTDIAIDIEVKNINYPKDFEASICVGVVEANKKLVRNLLHLGLLCCLPNPSARPSMRVVNRILQQKDDLDVAFTALPPLPTAKPSGLFTSLEYSQVKNSL